MKTRNQTIIGAAVCGLFLTVQSGFSQGPLTPAGPPAPTMKSLDQIEPRIPISSVPYFIDSGGSYYLTTNLTGTVVGVLINSGNVTLDLNGFALQGATSDSSIGIEIGEGGNHLTNITVRNGSVNGWGGTGVYSYQDSYNVVYEHLNVSANGDGGIFAGGATVVVSDCIVLDNIDQGISLGSGLISGCTVVNNSGDGIYAADCVVRDCRVNDNGDDGVNCNGGVISGCTVNDNADTGINVFYGSVSDCVVQDNGTGGVTLSEGKISDCAVDGNMGAGVSVTDGNILNCGVEDNDGNGVSMASGDVSQCSVQGNTGYGIYVGTGNVSDCDAQDNDSGYGISVESGKVSGCTAQDNSGDGIDMNIGSVLDCWVEDNGGWGIYMSGSGAVSRCAVQTSFYSGIWISTPGSRVTGNTCSRNDTAGSGYQHNIHIAASNNRVEDNQVTTSGFPGIVVDAGYTNNIVIKNSVIGNGAGNYSIPAGNDVGPIGTAATATSPWANFSH